MNVKPDSSKNPKQRERLTKQEMNELRAQGQCFVCKKEGHVAQNCPTRHNAPAPKVQMNAIKIKEIEELASENDKIEVLTCNIQVDPIYETEAYQNPICLEIRNKFIKYYGTNTYLDQKGRPQLCFTVCTYGEDFEVMDWTDVSISHMVKKEDIETGNWNVPLIIE